MAGYGGHEDYDDVLGKLGEAENSIDRLVAKEAAYGQELESTAKAEGRAGAQAERKLRVRRETREVVAREEAVAGRSAKAVDLDTAAIDRNTQARRRQAEVVRQQAINWRRVFAGARDPAFGQAYGIAGAQTTQYQIRQQLERVGSRRAGAIQEALRAGIQPAGPSATALGPITRLQAATAGVASADLAYEQARRDYANALKRKSTTEEEAAGYREARETAKSRRVAAQTELQAAEAEAAAKRANVAAIEREQAARAQATQAAVQETRARRTAIEAGPIGSTGRQPFGLLPAAGQTAQMPISPFTIQQARPGAFREIGFGGTVGGAVEPPYVRPPHMEEAGEQRVRLAKESADETARETAELKTRNEELARTYLATGRAAEAAQIYSTALGDQSRAAMAMRQSELDTFLEGNARRMQTLGQTTRNAGIEFYTFDQSMHRHGALTSEFIAAAARGETTLKELGNQAVITAGKFGGWTLAATGVYGLLGALQQIGKGAIDASSGVDQAFRVITSGQDADKLAGDFSDLAGKFNVPIDQAADAVYRMGQVFHDQEDATKAAESALYSFKTGEVDVATSTKNLIAIVNGFHLSADDLGEVYDQINQAQNRFGIGIGDTEAGLAKAAGSYRNAGGDLNYLLALFVAVQKATGRSGTEIGTGIARAVQRIREPISQAKLEAQGIEVDQQNFQLTLQRAFQAVAKNPGIDIQEVATGLFGNQYARLITPVLSDTTLLNQALKDTSPEASKDSAQKELARVLGQVDEQLKKVGISLQRLGEALARAGAFTFAGVLLKGLNAALEVSIKILDVFNALPAPVRQAVVLMGQAAVALAALRRLGATERLSGTPLGFLAAPEQRLRTHTVAGLRTSQQQSYNQIERAARGMQQAALEREVATIAAAKFERERAPLLRQANLDEAARAKIIQEGLAVEGQLLATERNLTAATARLEAERQLSTIIEADLATAQKTAAGAQFRQFMQQRQLIAPRQLDQPNLAGTAPESGFPGGVILPPGATRDAEEAAERARREASQGAQQARRTRNALSGAAAQLDLMGASLAGGATRGAAGRTLGRGLQATATRLEQAGRFLGNAATGARRIPGALRGLLASLGPLDIALAAFIGFEFLGNALEKSAQKMDEARSSVERVPRSAGELETHLEEVRKVAEDNGNRLKDTFQEFAELLNPINFGAEALDQIGVGPGYDSPEERRKIVQDIAKAEEDYWKRLAEIQKEQRQRGGPVQQQFAGEIIKSIQKTQADREAGLISQQEFDRQMANHAIEIHTAINSNAQTVALMKQAQANAQRSIQGYRQAIAGMDPETLDQNMQALLAQAGGTGMTPQILDRLAANYEELTNQLAGSTSNEDIIKLAEAREAYFDGLQKSAEADIKAGLATARSERERRQVFDEVTSRTTGAARRTVSDLRGKRDTAADKEAAARERLERLQGIQASTRTAGGEGAEDLQREIDKQKADVRRFAQDKKKFNSEYRAAKRKYEELKSELDRAAYEDRQTGREITLALRISRTADPAEQNRLTIQNARRQVEDAAKVFGKNSREYRQALTELNNARMQAAQQVIADINAENALMIAQAGNDPAARAKAQVQAEKNLLDAMTRNRSKYDPNAIKEQRARYIEAINQQQEQARQTAEDLARINDEIAVARAHGDPIAAAKAAQNAARRAMRNARTPVERAQALLDMINANNQMEDALREQEEARTDLLVASTDDPVEAARIERDAAKKALRGTTGVERLRRLADYRRKQKAYRDARIDSRLDDINFDLEMDKISNEEAARQIEELAKMKGISKQKKRELLLQAKRLRDEASGEYELDVGSLRLPTLYEVRRFVMGDTGGSGNWSNTVTDNRTFNVNISTAEGANAFAQQLELTNGTSARATARSARIR